MLLRQSDFGVTPADYAVLTGVYDRELDLDRFLPDGKRHRSRAYQCFDLTVAGLRFTPNDNPRPYVQSMSVNPLQGGLEREFRLVPSDHPVTAVTEKVARTVAESLLAAGVLDENGPERMVVDAHYIRIDAPGEPAPEGVHHDGLLAGSAHLVRRVGVMGGVSGAYDSPTHCLAGFELSEPLDSFVFDDRKVMHYTTPIAAIPGAAQAFRDVLLIGFRAI
nr:2OG-Fe dioxygenase family protein [Nocardia transvalensis]